MSRRIVCIGSVLWDVIGRSSAVMRMGSDVPGRITRLPGGVAMNIAMTLRRFGLTPVLLTSIGRTLNPWPHRLDVSARPWPTATRRTRVQGC